MAKNKSAPFRLNSPLFKHSMIWIFFALFAFIVDPPLGPLFVKITGTILIVFGYAYVYYTILFFILPKFYQKKTLLIFFSFIAFLGYLLLDYLTFVQFIEKYITNKWFTYASLYHSITTELLTYSLIYVAALGAYQNKIGSQKLLLKSQKEKSLLSAELEFIRNQFNSNMTFDFLTICQEQVKEDSNETAEGLSVFSRMLRYSTGINSTEKVLLLKEVEYIQDFIQLQKLLNSEISTNIILKNNNLNSVYILPRILIGFVENAFKHGDTVSTEFPIQIELYTTANELHFKVSNKKNHQKMIESSGIGNYNLKQHLELLYKNKYSLEVEDLRDTYTCYLKFPLSKSA